MYTDKITKQDLKDYITLCCGYNSDIDPEIAYTNTITYLKHHNGKKVNPDDMAEINRLFNQWYLSLDKDDRNPDYSVYGDPYYMFEVWLSWVNYARRYILDIQKIKKCKPHEAMYNISIADDMRRDGLKTILDLGCGFGYSTAAFKELFPECDVYGTNFETSLQFTISKDIGKTAGYTMLPDHSLLNNVDLVFASEYFEHIIDPIEHLRDIIEKCSPRYFLIASTFDQKAIGHFDTYVSGTQMLRGKEISLKFNNFLETHGYTFVEAGHWNNRPNYWKKISNVSIEKFL